jgi:2-polyprenyl-6-hydroxyphenyl methylase/3-demethylubiquinone-9 3-methyltransferase
MSSITVWGLEIPEIALSLQQVEYLQTLPRELPTVEWVWKEMDRVWGDFRLNNRRPLSAQPIGDYYMHPIWLMNGIFTALDPESRGHRRAIASCLDQRGAKRIADYGGGFGELALVISCTISEASVSIIEPYASNAGLERIRHESRIRIVPDLSVRDYDAIIAQDVLEHVEDPISLAYRIADSVRERGYVVFANCFYPVIKCHLPSAYHLRHTFRWVMQAMGLRYVGRVDGAEHAQMFERIGPIDLRRAKRAEQVSRFIGPLLNGVSSLKIRFRRMAVPR